MTSCFCASEPKPRQLQILQDKFCKVAGISLPCTEHRRKVGLLSFLYSRVLNKTGTPDLVNKLKTSSLRSIQFGSRSSLGHNYQLTFDSVPSKTVHSRFYDIFKLWNSLPVSVFEGGSLGSFKTSVNDLLLRSSQRTIGGVLRRSKVV